MSGRLTPFEVKHRAGITTRLLVGLTAFCSERRITEAYVITRDSEDFGLLKLPTTGSEAMAVKDPAPIACYWLGR